MPANLIAPFFHDLLVGLADSGVYTRVLGEAPNRRLIVEWRNFSAYDDGGRDAKPDYTTQLTFQTVLYEGSNDIVFLYSDLQGPLTQGESATIGLQNDGQGPGHPVRVQPAAPVGRQKPLLSLQHRGRQLCLRAVSAPGDRHRRIPHQPGPHCRRPLGSHRPN